MTRIIKVLFFLFLFFLPSSALAAESSSKKSSASNSEFFTVGEDGETIISSDSGALTRGSFSKSGKGYTGPPMMNRGSSYEQSAKARRAREKQKRAINKQRRHAKRNRQTTKRSATYVTPGCSTRSN